LSEGLEHEYRAEALMVAGDVAVARSMSDESIRLYQEATRSLADLPPRRGLLRYWRDLGDRFRELDEQRAAADCYERALTTARVADRSVELRRAVFGHARRP
jgi:tetratricopeptide (TPR) repeat protein